jgi:hypothetical protein
MTNFFSIVDEFCTDFDKSIQPFLIGNPYKSPSDISKSEVITICLICLLII